MTRTGCHVEAGAGRDVAIKRQLYCHPLARRVSAIAAIGKIDLDLGEFRALETESASNAKASPTRRHRCRGVCARRRAGAGSLLLALEVRQCVFEASDGAERRHRHGKLDFELRAGAPKQGRVAVAVASQRSPAKTRSKPPIEAMTASFSC